MIEDLLKNNEGKTLEFKENLQSLLSIVKTIIAFANTAGGTIVIGIEDKSKKIIGIKDSFIQEERLASVICDSITPQLMPDIEIQTYRNKELIIINVPHATGPYYLKSAGLEKGTYIRLRSTNRIVDEETLETLKNFAKNVYFDELPHLQGKTSDLDWNVINELFSRVNKKITDKNAYNLGLLTQHGTKELPTMGSIILFGINRLKLFPEAIIRCARFLGTDKNNLLDQADIETYLPLALEDAIKFVRKNTRMAAEIKELARKDIPEYPLVAVREAITNALVHADYAVKGVYISIAIFDDRMEITNPGGLPFGVTIKKALDGTSRIRNRVIAKVFYHLKWIEQWGSGIGRIIHECEQRGLQEPLFQELNNQFRVTLYSISKRKQILEKWQKDLIKYLKKHEIINTKQAALLWNVTTRTARLRLIKLVQAGLVRKTSTSLKDPKGYYVLN